MRRESTRKLVGCSLASASVRLMALIAAPWAKNPKRARHSPTASLCGASSVTLIDQHQICTEPQCERDGFPLSRIQMGKARVVFSLWCGNDKPIELLLQPPPDLFRGSRPAQFRHTHWRAVDGPIKSGKQIGFTDEDQVVQRRSIRYGGAVPRLVGVTTRVAVFTPLPVVWPHSLCAITRNIRIVDTPTFSENHWDLHDLRPSERATVLESGHWLCAEAECQWQEKAGVLSRLGFQLRNAMLGFQLWCPKGWDGIVIEAILTDAGAISVNGVELVEPYPMSRWSKMMDLGAADAVKLSPLVDGTLRAFESEAVRTINPFQLLEIGLQTAFNHWRAGALLWTVGLDAVLAAQKRERFSRRLIRLLAKDTHVFPKDQFGRRPTHTVGEVAAGMYSLRNLIAHGTEVLKEYRQPFDFQFEPRELSYLREEWTFETLLSESSLFTLIAALRKVILEDKLEMMADKRAWRSGWTRPLPDSPPTTSGLRDFYSPQRIPPILLPAFDRQLNRRLT